MEPRQKTRYTDWATGWMIRHSNHCRRRKFHYLWKSPDLSGYREAVFVGLKRPDRYADHSICCSEKVTDERSRDSVITISLHGVHRGNFILPLPLQQKNAVTSEVTHSFR
jgi:hypothetical protein